MRPPPPPVLPTVAEVPCLHPDAEDAIGELRVEVLEAANLEGDWWSAADAYALLQFERHCAVSSIIWNQSNPAWGAHADHRAFRFPVHHSYSTLCVALVESDTHERAGLLSHFFDSDDHIGRVVIRLGTLYESTVYDSWFALNDIQKARSAIPDTKSAAGAALRLRYSVTFTTERHRMYSYLGTSPSLEAEHELAFHASQRRSVEYEQAARYALFGRTQIGVYKWETLMGHVEELTAGTKRLETCVACIERVIFWRPGSRLASLLTCIGFQLLVSYPNFLPATLCLLFLLNLRRTYSNAQASRRGQSAVRSRPSFTHVVCSLLALHRPHGNRRRHGLIHSRHAARRP